MTTISSSVVDGVALVRFDRPERGNGWTAQMQQEYRAVMAQVESDPAVRAVVINGSGRAFCVGADMEALAAITQSGSLTVTRSDALADSLFGTDLGSFAFVQRMSKPVIAAVNGSAAGVGFVIASFCDVRYVATGCKLTVAMARLGLPAEQGISWILPRIVGAGHAAHLLMASPVISAEEALRIGWANQILAPEAVLDAAMDYARGIASGISPASARMMKAQLYGDLETTLPAAIAAATAQVGPALTSEDYREGVAAFAGRRAPKFGDP